MKRLAAALFCLAFAGALHAQQTILLVRHAEKATDSNEAAVPLSEAGAARAARLAEVLKSAGVTAVYATDTVRARKTAEPLAKAAALEVRIYAPKGSDGKPAPGILVERLKKEEPKGIVLVVGHSNTVPEILAALGYTARVEIPSSQYDDLFVVTPRAEGPPSVVRLKY
jgi:2,3-bisphosphoglycerate-dependent phosphoglycerate mutase